MDTKMMLDWGVVITGFHRRQGQDEQAFSGYLTCAAAAFV
jgi:hypothetical protein